MADISNNDLIEENRGGRLIWNKYATSLDSRPIKINRPGIEASMQLTVALAALMHALVGGRCTYTGTSAGVQSAVVNYSYVIGYYINLNLT